MSIANKISSVLWERDYGDGRKELLYNCPACGNLHFVRVGTWPGGAVWTWDGNAEKPTFSPSIKVTGTQPVTDAEVEAITAGQKIAPRPLCCHFFIRAGQIEYCGDCTHAMAGKTVPMEPINQ